MTDSGSWARWKIPSRLRKRTKGERVAAKQWNLAPQGPLRGELSIPGDKSVSHRSLLFGALCEGESRVDGLLESGDVYATRGALAAMGVGFETQGSTVTISPPKSGLSHPHLPIDCGNSGTTMRLLSGLVAGQELHATLIGDHSLMQRPMARVIGPLREMGVRISGSARDTLAPLTLSGGPPQAIRYQMPVASAQLKSCLMLAGLKCGVSFREDRQSRDHTERMLSSMGATLHKDSEGWTHLAGGARLKGMHIHVPGDLSAAAFWLVAGAITPGSFIRLPGVGMNPSRTGVLDALRAMGADIRCTNERHFGEEPVADLEVRHSALTGVEISGGLALRCLDELPVLAVAAAHAEGQTTIRDAGELRHKESDRIRRVVQGLQAIDAKVEETEDGMKILGNSPRGTGLIDAHGDHRIAMAFAVSARAGATVRIQGAQSVQSSYPLFLEHLEQLSG